MPICMCTIIMYALSASNISNTALFPLCGLPPLAGEVESCTRGSPGGQFIAVTFGWSSFRLATNEHEWHFYLFGLGHFARADCRSFMLTRTLFPSAALCSPLPSEHS